MLSLNNKEALPKGQILQSSGKKKKKKAYWMYYNFCLTPKALILQSD